MKLSVCIITGPSSKTILNTLESIKDIADEICITQTCKDDETTKVINEFSSNNQVELKYEICPELMHEDGFLRSFAETRNKNWELATGDMIFWIDTDDSVYEPQALRKEIERLNDIGCDRITMDYDYEFDNSGNCTTRHQRERVLRRGYFKWIAPIHEVTTPLRRATTAHINRNISYIIHNNIIEKDNEKRKQRNLTMLERIIKEEPDHVRMRMYYANSLVDVGRYDEAEIYYKEYLQKSEWDEERYQVMFRLCNIYKKYGRIDMARSYVMQAMCLFPRYKHAYLVMAELSALSKKWEDVIEWINIMNDRIDQDSSMLINPLANETLPFILLQQAYLKLGDFEKSYKATLELQHLIPAKRKQLEVFGKNCLKQIQDMKLIKSYQTILSCIPEEDRQIFYDNVPKRISDFPDFKKKKTKIRDSKKRTVAIYCGYDDTRSWGPEDISKGIGGSEEAVINVSKIFADKGWNVEVYCNCTNEGLIDGVRWYQTSCADPDDTVDLLIAWRNPHMILHAPRGIQRWIWLHDLQYGMKAYYDEDIMKQIDKVMFLSNFHRSTAPWVKDEKVFITSNAVDPNLMFDGNNNSNTVIYASSPDRGLDTLVELWPQVIKEKPQARLKVFYGFNEWFDKRYVNNPQMLKWKDDLLAKMQADPTIEYFGSVGQERLGVEISESGIWAYPTKFEEISCITAMKMQCGGAIPICTTTAALNETVKYGIKIKGNKEKFDKDIFLAELINMIGNDKEQNEIRVEMKNYAKNKFQWSKVVDSWIEEFQKKVVKHGVPA